MRPFLGQEGKTFPAIPRWGLHSLSHIFPRSVDVNTHSGSPAPYQCWDGVNIPNHILFKSYWTTYTKSNLLCLKVMTIYHVQGTSVLTSCNTLQLLMDFYKLDAAIYSCVSRHLLILFFPPLGLPFLCDAFLNIKISEIQICDKWQRWNSYTA